MVELQEIYDKLLEIELQLQTLSRTKSQKVYDITKLTEEKGKVNMSEVMNKLGVSRGYAIDILKRVGSHKGLVFVRGDLSEESCVCKKDLLKDWELVVAQLTRKDYEKNRVIALADLQREHNLNPDDVRMARSRLVGSGLWGWNPNNPDFIRRVK